MSIYSLFVDQNTNDLYISDIGAYTFRIQRWTLNGATAGVTVAGANGPGPALNQISVIYGLFVDLNSNIFISDINYHRVTKWTPNAISGILVAGTGVSGSNLTQLNAPQGIWIEQSGNLFVADTGNHRVVKWINGATTGILVAGGQGPGSSSLQLNSPSSVIVDVYGNLFVLDQGNSRIQQFTPGNLIGVTIFDGSRNATFSGLVYSMVMDSFGNLYVADYYGSRVQKISLVSASVCTASTTPSTNNCSSLIFNPNANTVISNLTGNPYAVALDAYNNIYVTDSTIRVYKFSGNTTLPTSANVIIPMTNQTINTGGSTLSQIGLINALFIDQASNNIYLSDTGSYCPPTYCYYYAMNNYRIQLWSLVPGTVAGTTVAGIGVYGAPGLYNTIATSYGLYLDSNGTLFVSDYGNHRVTKWIRNSVSGIFVAGTGISGSNLTYLNGPRGVWVYGNGDLLVVDSYNHRVVKWSMNATSGILVAGGLGQGPFSVQLSYPTAIVMDSYGNMFILDSGNQRIQLFTPGSNIGITVFDGSYNSAFSMSSSSMAMDSFGNLYVPDFNGMRIQKINVVSSSSCTGMLCSRQ
ncbi:unnamed protein product [Rotaria sp. Silwood2]|nr:unnamed protein product [Rotaria sp. Silwood2]CAF3008942.1 unnamed protein product [Rotaria sp. Silwood2]CAF3371872.1 unnamed protein product [Rotaria sp. Silwood2]CAF4221561.1 unnamed protein product [Rotaria sp. Silwood2]CAF4294293.1 unnamed protein product [Rotaria sp. Silwood2]